MVNPVIALLIAGLFGGAAALLFWPVRGLYWRWEHVLRASDRVLSEDALKHLFDCEYREIPGTLQGVSGALGISDDRAAGLLARLQQLELVASEAAEYRLTAEGRAQALQIIRVHRLWEHHFSEDTGMDAAAWHREADRLEHRTSPEDAEAMAARLGYPRFDPHGDPIPTASGEMRAPAGRPLSDLVAGEVGQVTHIEDEPDVVYRELLAADLHVGTQVKVLATDPAGIRFEADGVEHVLSPVVANNLAVGPLPAGREEPRAFGTLASLKPGESGTVVGIAAACRGVERRRMMDLGIVPGTVIRAELEGPGGDPIGYRIRGAVIALRRQQAERIQIEPGARVAEGAVA
ncbi:MAG: iron dependent repressor, metal binding and dimerization domain protein [Acidobacteriota bacterium]|jgi:DtxR family Mn-dependent transcriptional regulator